VYKLYHRTHWKEWTSKPKQEINKQWPLTCLKLHNHFFIAYSSVGKALGYGLALGPTQPPIQWVAGALFLGVKWLGYEADHSPPSSAEVKEWEEVYLHSPYTPPWHGTQKKAQTLPLPSYNPINCILQLNVIQEEIWTFVLWEQFSGLCNMN